MFCMGFRRFFVFSCFAAVALFGASLPAGAAADDGKRLALVIGNSTYRGEAALTNPANDAADIAKKLKALKFEVLLATNADLKQMRGLLDQFRSKLTRNHVGLVFYAGHGVTVNGESFLLPVDVPAEIVIDEKDANSTDKLNANLVSMASVLAPLEGAKVGIVFLDACRANAAEPGAGLRLRVSSLGTQRALPILRGTGSLQVKPSPYSAGVFRAYATQLDNVAADGAGRNSPFTKALLKHIDARGVSIQELMIRVRKSVMLDTQNQQVPWEEAALNDSFYFLPPDLAPAALPARAASAATPARVAPRTATRASSPAPASRPSGNNLPPNLGVGVGAGM
jgi:uncharacterized caspase-like protein